MPQSTKSLFPNPLKLPKQESFVIASEYLNSELLIDAYFNGLFPWPSKDWQQRKQGKSIQLYPFFSPNPRAILMFKDFHVSKSLKRAMNGFYKNKENKITWNTQFKEVIENCANIDNRAQPKHAWLLPEMQLEYIRLHELGFAKSVEVWSDNNLVGGVYGVLINGAFSAESMFSKIENASKMALVFLIAKLTELNLSWMDIQQLTPHMQKMGAIEISRENYYTLLRSTQKNYE